MITAVMKVKKKKREGKKGSRNVLWLSEEAKERRRNENEMIRERY